MWSCGTSPTACFEIEQQCRQALLMLERLRVILPPLCNQTAALCCLCICNTLYFPTRYRVYRSAPAPGLRAHRAFGSGCKS